MNLFTIIAYIAVGLTGVVVVLSVFAVLSRMYSERREVLIRETRSRLRQTLLDYLSGNLGAEQVQTKLRNEPLLLGVLVQLANEVTADERAKLYPLFESFGLVRQQLALLTDRSWAKRSQAANRLGYMGSAAAIPSLTAALTDEMLDVRLSAAHALANLKAAEAVPAILRNLSLPAQWPLQRVAETLAEMGDVAVEPLLASLADPDTTDAAQAAAIRALGMLHAVTAGAVVLDHVRHASDEIRVQSAKALGDLGERRAVTPLTWAMNDPVWEVRAAASRSLGQLGDETGVPVLSKHLADPAWWVRFNCATALYQLGADGIEALRAALSHEDAFAQAISRQVLQEHGLLAAETELQP